MQQIRIATRQSKLALWQANFVRDQLRLAHPNLIVELHGITTQGDKWLKAPLSEVGGKGLFVKELETAMLAGDAHIAVHSAKDLPAQLPAQFNLPVLAYREQVEDAIIGAVGSAEDPLSGLREGATVGSSSLRRKSQLLARRPDLNVVPIRGNVDSRLAKLDAGEYDAIVLAAAGLNRLGIKRQDLQLLTQDFCLPAPGQGALGIECVAGHEVEKLLTPLLDPAVAACVTAERGISAGLGADCSLPVAAHASFESGTIVLRALLSDDSGQQIIRTQQSGSDPVAVAAAATAHLFAQGAQSILDGLRT